MKGVSTAPPCRTVPLPVFACEWCRYGSMKMATTRLVRRAVSSSYAACDTAPSPAGLRASRLTHSSNSRVDIGAVGSVPSAAGTSTVVPAVRATAFRTSDLTRGGFSVKMK
eukprot:521784-Prymnesium_polylepis.1